MILNIYSYTGIINRNGKFQTQTFDGQYLNPGFTTTSQGEFIDYLGSHEDSEEIANMLNSMVENQNFTPNNSELKNKCAHNESLDLLSEISQLKIELKNLKIENMDLKILTKQMKKKCKTKLK